METKRFQEMARAIVKNLNQYELWLLENLVVEYRTGEKEWSEEFDQDEMSAEVEAENGYGEEE